jgi:hypothetical protein
MRRRRAGIKADLESPLPVGAAIVASLVLAVAVLVVTSQLVPPAVVGFALLFGFFDLLEVVHQVGVARSNLVSSGRSGSGSVWGVAVVKWLASLLSASAIEGKRPVCMTRSRERGRASS